MRRVRIVPALLSLVLCALSTGALVPAGAARSEHGLWGSVANLSRASATTYAPDVAIDSDGNALAVWVRGDGSRSRLVTASRRAGSSWSSPSGVPGTRGAVEAQVAFDGSGDAVVAWAAGRSVLAVRRSEGGSWGDPAPLHQTAGGKRGTIPAYLDLAVNRRGGAVVAWETMDDDRDSTYAVSRVQAAVGAASGGWTKARTLSSSSTTAMRAEAVVSRRGRATVVWAQASGANWQVMSAYRESGGTWVGPTALSAASVQSGTPRIASLASGDLAVAWGFETSSSAGILVRRWSPESGWASSASVPGIRADVRWLDVGIDRRKSVTVGWTSSANAVWAAEVTADGKWTRGPVAGRGSVFHGLEIAVNRAGDTLLGWDSVNGSQHPVVAAYRPRGGAWDSPTVLSPVGDAGGISLAVEPGGDAVAAWLYRRDGSVRSRVQSRMFYAE